MQLLWAQQHCYCFGIRICLIKLELTTCGSLYYALLVTTTFFKLVLNRTMKAANSPPDAVAGPPAQQNAIAVKLPVFWTLQLHVWLEQAEAQFHIQHITADDTKYYYVAGDLDKDTAGRLVHLLRQPPSAVKYDGLKTLLLCTFGLSKRERTARILYVGGLGDRKPSDLSALQPAAIFCVGCGFHRKAGFQLGRGAVPNGHACGSDTVCIVMEQQSNGGGHRHIAWSS
ncbi:uncharacterized protein LOC129711752 isoform X2 [Leucoraja erinacea]|uniref:uncharacterized protein LOC129711752 isoform X2 n=1 Tax=Leucoraja erinaceus TaxID=7782 RepID=UPI002458BBD4|nr:uncharacterized protein LOC129711752 isoform X2 [Leucoraja erinacea]